MTELDQAISVAIANQGKQEDVNKVYLTLLRTALFIPIHLEKEGVQKAEAFRPLYAKIEGHYFMSAFDTLERLERWAGGELKQMNYVELTGRDVIAGIKEEVYLCLNIDTPFYKEFSPDEIKRLKMLVARLDQLKA